VRVREDPADPVVTLASGEVDHPAIVESSNGAILVVWSEGLGAGSMIKMRSCTPTAGAPCDDVNDWTQVAATVHTGNRLRHPNIVTDGNRQMVTFMEDVGAEQNRVRFKSRCATGTWAAETAETIQHPEGDPLSTWDQAMFFGHIQMAADRGDNIVHATFVEADDYDQQATIPHAGSVWWTSRSYLDCP
jgi:hypothetical protein